MIGTSWGLEQELRCCIKILSFQTREVCMGTACYVLGASKSIKKFEDKLGIKVGEQTKDNKFALTQSRCLGCCGLAPVISINGEIQGKVTEDKVEEILSKLD